MTGKFVIFDTSVLINHLRTGHYAGRIASVEGLIRSSSVVLAELWRGATKTQEHKFIESLARNHPVLTPTEKNWWESGQILAKIRAHKGFTPEKLRDLHFDVLIALTTRSHGARLITANGADFAMISSYKKLAFEVW